MYTFLASWKDAAPAAGALTAVLSAVVALIVLQYTRAANRRRATLDMVMKTLLDDSVQKGIYEFKSLLRKNEDKTDDFKLSSFAAKDKKGTPERALILSQLNIYELVALGIKRGIFDEKFYKRWYHNQFISDYEGCKEFIEVLQRNKSSIFCECSSLYDKWIKDGHPDHSPNRIVMAWWALTKQHHRIDNARANSKAR